MSAVNWHQSTNVRYSLDGLNDLLSKAIRESFCLIAQDKQLHKERAAIRNEIISTRDLITSHPAWQELEAAIRHWIDQRCEVERRRWKLQILNAKADLELQKSDFEAERRQFTSADLVTKRMLVLKDSIAEMLPMPHKEFERKQVIRSRGLVMSALAGMTSVGGSSDSKDESKKQVAA
jgi:hypothetical protein